MITIQIWFRLNKIAKKKVLGVLLKISPTKIYYLLAKQRLFCCTIIYALGWKQTGTSTSNSFREIGTSRHHAGSPGTSREHHSNMVPKGSREGPQLSPHYAERRKPLVQPMQDFSVSVVTMPKEKEFRFRLTEYDCNWKTLTERKVEWNKEFRSVSSKSKGKFQLHHMPSNSTRRMN